MEEEEDSACMDDGSMRSRGKLNMVVARCFASILFSTKGNGDWSHLGRLLLQCSFWYTGMDEGGRRCAVGCA